MIDWGSLAYIAIPVRFSSGLSETANFSPGSQEKDVHCKQKAFLIHYATQCYRKGNNFTCPVQTEYKYCPKTLIEQPSSDWLVQQHVFIYLFVLQISVVILGHNNPLQSNTSSSIHPISWTRQLTLTLTFSLHS